MATSKKTGPAKSKSLKSKPAETKIDDAVVVEDVTSSDPVVDQSDVVAEAAADKPEPVGDATPDTHTDTVAEAAVLETPNANAEMVHPVPTIVTKEDNKGGTFLPLVLGGVVAGAIGFFVGQSAKFGADDAGITTKLRSDLTAQQERIAALETAEQPAAEMQAVDLSPLETQLDAIESRLSALENRTAGGASVDSAELQALQSSIETQRSEIQTLLDNAKTVEEATADAAKAAVIQAAIAKIVSALDAGQPFAGPLEELKAAAGDIDPALASVAESGVATMSALQSDFPDQARAALATARANGVEEGQQGFNSFLKRALGARSVAPREGDDPDAVLSRAEAAIKTGDLSATLAELDTLPEEAQAAIADWRAAADARVAARAAADVLSKRLTAD